MTWKRNFIPISNHSTLFPHHSSWETLIYFFFFLDLLILNISNRRNHTICFLSVRWFSLSMFSRFFCVIAHIHYFINFYGWIILHCMYILTFLSPFISWYLIDVHLGCFRFALLWTMLLFINSVLCGHMLGYIPRNWIAGSCGNFMFKFLKNYQLVFHGCCTILRSYQKCIRVPLYSHTYQQLFFHLFDLDILGVLNGITWWFYYAFP